MFSEYLDELAKQSGGKKSQHEAQQAQTQQAQTQASYGAGKLIGKVLDRVHDCRSALYDIQRNQFQLLDSIMLLGNEFRRQQPGICHSVVPFVQPATGQPAFTGQPAAGDQPAYPTPPERMSLPASRTEEDNAAILNLLSSMDNELSELRTLVSRVLVTLSQSCFVDQRDTPSS